jgi:3-isopropylmalate dehydrogenase
MLLNWLGNERQRADLADAGQAISDALDATVADPSTRTRDLGGTLDTHSFAKAVAANLRNLPLSG